MSGPIDPAVERVARALVKLDDHPGHEALLMSLRATLLAHDHWEAKHHRELLASDTRAYIDAQLAEARAEADALDDKATRLTIELSKADARAKRYRSRCPVTSGDVEAAAVTRRGCEAWLRTHGFEAYDSAGFTLGHSTLWRDGDGLHACTTSASVSDASAAISRLADSDPERCAFDILDEMAALTPEPTP